MECQKLNVEITYMTKKKKKKIFNTLYKITKIFHANFSLN